MIAGIEGTGAGGIAAGSVAGWDDRVLEQVVRRASSRGYERWWHRVARSGFCARPVHLAGVDGFGRELAVLGRCKNRRASVCPSCADLYAGDTWQLVHAGVAGGHHGMPVSVAGHPAVFATLTAPGFGAVHTCRDEATGGARKCHSSNGFRRCRHGRPVWCGAVHDAADPVVGEPLCPDFYDYAGHVLFSWWAPELWRRFTIALRRQLATALRAGGADPAGVRVSFVKVVEFQRRAVPHFHAIIRLDGPPGADGQPTPPPAAAGVDAVALAGLVHEAAARVVIDVPGPGGEVAVRFGAQTDAQPLTGRDMGSEHCGGAPGSGDGAQIDPRRSPRRVAGYLAKYVGKSVGEFGLAPHRLSPQGVGTLAVREHIRTVLAAVRDLSALPGYAPMLAWLHTLGYRGHISTKSRRFSTTMAALRARREAWQHQHTAGHEPANLWAVGETGWAAEGLRDEPPVVWRFQRVGHVCEGDRLLAISAAARAREHRIIARDEYRELLAADNDWAAA
jgi:hypothetical protein